MLPELAKHSEKLYYFYEVALMGGLQSSARKLGLSAPTISYAIKQLELVTNAQLFHRSKNGMTLTLAGEHLLIFCKKYFQELGEVEFLMKNPKHDPITRIKIGTFQSIAIYYWPYLLELLKSEPNISLSINTNRSSHVVESLINKEIDLALTVEGKQHPKLIRHELYTDEYCICASTKFKPNRITQKQAKDFILMYIPDAMDSEGLNLRRHLYMRNLEFKEVFDLDSFEVIAEFVKKNYGFGILPRKVTTGLRKTVKEIRIDGMAKKAFGKHRFFLTYRNDLDLPQSLMDLFVNAAFKAAKKMSL